MPVKMEFPQGWGFDSLLDHTGMLDSWLGGAMVAREIPALMTVFFFWCSSFLYISFILYIDAQTIIDTPLHQFADGSRCSALLWFFFFLRVRSTYWATTSLILYMDRRPRLFADFTHKLERERDDDDDPHGPLSQNAHQNTR